MKLDFIHNENQMTIFLPEKVDTTNAQEVETAILSLLEGKHVSDLVLSCQKTSYISSIGLRMVMKLLRLYPKLSVKDCNPEVYEIFEMTGFVQMLPVSKAFREISIEGCPIIGNGAYGRVYRLDNETILKSYYRGNPISDIEREQTLAREAFILGVPTALSFDVVKVKEEGYGAVYELINSSSLLSCFQNHPDEYDHYLDLYVGLLDKLRHTSTEDAILPTTKEDDDLRLASLEHALDEPLFAEIKARLDSMSQPNLLVHGDCHFKNVFVGDGELILIDMDTLSRGNPLLELANLHRTYVAFEEVDPGNLEKFLGVSAQFAKKLYDDLLLRLYPDEKQRRITGEQIRFLSYFLLLSHYVKHLDQKRALFEKTKDLLLSLLPKLEPFE